MNVRVLMSDDGGKNFKTFRARGTHSDNHAIAFRKDDPDYFLVGTDGGLPWMIANLSIIFLEEHKTMAHMEDLPEQTIVVESAMEIGTKHLVVMDTNLLLNLAIQTSSTPNLSKGT